MKVYSCYYEEFEDIATFINCVVIYNHNHCQSKSENIIIKNVTILPVKLDYFECEGYFQFETDATIENLKKVLDMCRNLNLMKETIKEGLQSEDNFKEYFVV
jgi:hypothetical protein